MGRFLYCVPPTLLGSRPAITPAVLESVERRYNERLTALLSMPSDVDREGRPKAHDLIFDEGADAEMASIQEWVEPQLGPWGELRQMADWAGKLAGNCARIASVLHLGELSELPRPWSIPLSGAAIREVRKVGEYLVHHARAAFQAMGADEATEGARHILRWLKAHPVGRFSRRNLHRRLIRSFEAVEKLDEALAILMDRGYIRQTLAETGGRPGPKPVLFDVHPEYAGEGGELEGE